VQNFKQSYLRCFVTVAELGSVSAAAEALHRTASAVSMTVSNLESQFGRPLFEAGSKARLTPFGAYVFEIARQQLEHFDRCMDSIRAYARNDFGRVDIATVPSFASSYLPGILADYVGRYPQVVLSIGDNTSLEICRLVEQGRVDVGIASPPEESSRLHFRPLFSDLLGVVCSPSHPLAALDHALEWRDLTDHRLIANGTCALIHESEFRALLAASDMAVQNTTSLLSLVAAGLGFTTLPRLAVPAEREDVVFMPTRYEHLQRNIGIITSARRSLSPAAAAFVASVEATFQSGGHSED